MSRFYDSDIEKADWGTDSGSRLGLWLPQPSGDCDGQLFVDHCRDKDRPLGIPPLTGIPASSDGLRSKSSKTAHSRRFSTSSVIDSSVGLSSETRATLMSAPSRDHQGFLVELSRQISTFLLDRPCEVYVAPFDVRLPKGHEPDLEVDTVVQPDLVVYCDSSRLDDAGARGAPDWIIEIASPSTSTRDQTVKRDLYERHGVREYWMIDPIRRSVTVFERSSSGAFDEPKLFPVQGVLAVSTLPGLSVELDRLPI